MCRKPWCLNWQDTATRLSGDSGAGYHPSAVSRTGAGQLDQDSLPPYDILDALLAGYVEKDMSADELIAAGFDEAVVRKVIRLVDINEYKRRQSPVGPRITARNFGKDRRYPITSGFGRKNW